MRDVGSRPARLYAPAPRRGDGLRGSTAGEAREADYGIAGGKGVGVLFKKANACKTLPYDQLAPALCALILREQA